jgi:ElaB/YqjD/DUF883 family membrane-anchored ribosome-binding protein
MEVESRLAKIESEMAAMREKISFFSVIYDKFDATLAKLEKMIEDRRSDTNEDLKDVYSRIEHLETKLMDEMSKLRSEMKAQHQAEQAKIDDLNKWRWFVVGASAVVGFIISTVVKVWK